MAEIKRSGAEIKRSGEVWLKESERPWSIKYSCRTSARLLHQLITQNPYAIRNTVLPETGLDQIDRSKKEDPQKKRPLKKNMQQDDDDDEASQRAIHDQHWMDKALAMEMLGTVMLTCLDDPQEVISTCRVDDNGDPHSHAGQGAGDGLAHYESFSILLEVSSKKDMDIEDFRTQMGQAIEHGGQLAKERGHPVYALVINECAIETESVFLEAYNSFLPVAKEKGDVRPIAIRSLDFVDILDELHSLDHGSYDVAGDMVYSALDAIWSHLSQRVTALKEGDMVRGMLKTLRSEPELLQPR